MAVSLATILITERITDIIKGKVARVKFRSFAQIEGRFQKEWKVLAKEAKLA